MFKGWWAENLRSRWTGFKERPGLTANCHSSASNCFLGVFAYVTYGFLVGESYLKSYLLQQPLGYTMLLNLRYKTTGSGTHSILFLNDTWLSRYSIFSRPLSRGTFLFSHISCTWVSIDVAVVWLIPHCCFQNLTPSLSSKKPCSFKEHELLLFSPRSFLFIIPENCMHTPSVVHIFLSTPGPAVSDPREWSIQLQTAFWWLNSAGKLRQMHTVN